MKIQNLEKNVKKQSRTSKAKQNQKHKTTQNSPKSLLPPTQKNQLAASMANFSTLALGANS
jgi:hypothetical protein